MGYELRIRIDRSAKSTLAEQICRGVIASIRSGVLVPGARLPSWITLAEQLGVARGTVKTAYDRLVDEQVVVSSRSGGTRVARRPPVATQALSSQEMDAPPALYRHLLAGPGIFRMGVPPPGGLPASVLARLRAQAARMEVDAPAVYPDPRGEAELRRAIAAHVALARGIEWAIHKVSVVDRNDISHQAFMKDVVRSTDCLPSDASAIVESALLVYRYWISGRIDSYLEELPLRDSLSWLIGQWHTTRGHTSPR